jgi:hypothetical protein
MNDKIIVTNNSALRKKYGAQGFKAIQAALKALIAADKPRGFKTRAIALDNQAALKKLNAPAVTDAADARQNKAAIDGIYRALAPEYLMILGAPDVVPHVDLKNPVYDGVNDPDEFAYGDLPYACDAPYSQKPQDFIGPTRVVGRLPDLAGAKDPVHLIDLLQTAANARSLTASDYAKHLGISAKVWEKSTALSLEKLFGFGKELHNSPKEGPGWKDEQLQRRTHFINCHGAPADPNFYGQSGNKFPVAHAAVQLAGKISEGTVVAAECCYGAELYDPSLLEPRQMGIGNSYLANQAYGYFGSTTIAYGPAEGNGAADLICQYFLKQVLAGSSLGRAALEAQQEFVASDPVLDPVDLKTLAQFILLGDPSLHPVAAPTPHRMMLARALAPLTQRVERREQLAKRGIWLALNQAVAQRLTIIKTAKAVPGDQAALNKLLSEAALESTTTLTFEVKAKATPKLALLAKAAPSVKLHVVLGKRKDGAQCPSDAMRIVALVAKEVNGKVLSYRELLAKTTEQQ